MDPRFFVEEHATSLIPTFKTQLNCDGYPIILPPHSASKMVQSLMFCAIQRPLMCPVRLHPVGVGIEL
ncbi:MAG: hypothetical protein DWI22_03530 [Planctomycetota bacterium]|nr:MAG: hypothetical protein DWI22_03530 [Planctomycetota bacterium]